MNIKDIVKDNTVHLDRLRKGIAYYQVNVDKIEKYEFPVPLDDIGDATLLQSDKAIFYMRYIKKAIEDGTFIKLS